MHITCNHATCSFAQPARLVRHMGGAESLQAVVDQAADVHEVNENKEKTDRGADDLIAHDTLWQQPAVQTTEWPVFEQGMQAALDSLKVDHPDTFGSMTLEDFFAYCNLPRTAAKKKETYLQIQAERKVHERSDTAVGAERQGYAEARTAEAARVLERAGIHEQELSNFLESQTITNAKEVTLAEGGTLSDLVMKLISWEEVKSQIRTDEGLTFFGSKNIRAFQSALTATILERAYADGLNTEYLQPGTRITLHEGRIFVLASPQRQIMAESVEAVAQTARREAVSQLGATQTELVGIRADIAAKQAEIADATSRLGGAHEEVLALRGQLAQLEGRSAEVSLDIARLQAGAGGIEELTTYTNTLSEERRDVSNELAADSAQLHALTRQRDDLQGTVAELHAAIDAQRVVAVDIQRQADELAEPSPVDRNESAFELRAAQNRVAALEVRAGAARVHVEQREAQLTSAEDALRSATEARDEHVASLTAARDLVRSSADTLALREQGLADAHTELDPQIAVAEQKLSMLQGRLTRAEATQGYFIQSDEVPDYIADMQQAVAEKTTELDRMQTQLADLESAVSSARIEHTLHEEHVAWLEARTSRVDQGYERALYMRDGADENLAQARDDFARMPGMIAAARADLDTVRDAHATAQAEHGRAIDSYTSMAEKLVAAATELANDVRTMQSELAGAEQEIASLDSAIVDATQEHDATQARLARLNDAHTEAMEDMAILRGRHTDLVAEKASVDGQAGQVATGIDAATGRHIALAHEVAELSSELGELGTAEDATESAMASRMAALNDMVLAAIRVNTLTRGEMQTLATLPLPVRQVLLAKLDGLPRNDCCEALKHALA